MGADGENTADIHRTGSLIGSESDLSSRHRGLMRRGKTISERTKQEMLMKILLATDGSEQAEAAVDEIVNRHFQADAEVRVISVVELPSFPVTVPWAGVD